MAHYIQNKSNLFQYGGMRFSSLVKIKPLVGFTNSEFRFGAAFN